MQLPLPPTTRYDHAARHLLLQAGGVLVDWLLPETPARPRFERWLPTQLTLPGVPQRLCDGIAALTDAGRGPVAALLGVQTKPDPTMPGRLMLAGALLWLTVKPTPLPGDRYELLGVVINLTGVGDAARGSVVGTAEWSLKPVEVNLGTRDAAEVLEQIAGGAAPRELLGFIPLMQRGDEEGIIQRWREVVAAEADPSRRGDYGLARVFADLLGREEAWENVMQDLDFIESPTVAKWMASARAEARSEALVQERVDSVLRVLRRLSRELPDELTASIRSCADPDRLSRWFDDALEAQSLADFRARAEL